MAAVGWLVTVGLSPLVPAVSATAMPEGCHECCDAMVGAPDAPMPGHDMPRCCVMQGAPAPATTPDRAVSAGTTLTAVPVVASVWFQPPPPAAVPPPADSPPPPIPVLQRTSVLLI